MTVGAAGTPVALSLGISVPINLTVGAIMLSGGINLNAGAVGVVNTGTMVAGDAALLTIGLTARINTGPAPIQVAAVELAVAPLHVDATSPKDGIQCATAPTPPPTTVTPPTTPPIPSGAPQTGAGGTAGVQEGALIALGLVLLVSGAGAGSMAYRRRRAGHAA
ncbi:MAG: hypothetical protein DLM57_02145 [Pseudonocardiales bacterium]|nr:MAG: hypothetical protein DLM57_02145 [Pseudonocardiales bacterium]